MALIDKIRNFLTEPPLPPFLLQITANRLTGLRVKAGASQENRYFILPLEAGLLEPSAEKSNLLEPPKLKSLIEQGLRKIGGLQSDLSLLLPEACFRLFIFTAENLPSSTQEKLALIKWRLKKLYPLIPDDFRFDFQTWQLNSSLRVLVAGARASIIEEYEKLLAGAGCRVRVIGLPTIYLLPLVEEPDYLLVNVERDYLALLVSLNHVPLLYRMKSFRWERGTDLKQTSLAEIENTLHFIEDKEKRQIRKIYLRWAVEDEVARVLTDNLEQAGLEVRPLKTDRFAGFRKEERILLAPLLGQIANKEK